MIWKPTTQLLLITTLFLELKGGYLLPNTRHDVLQNLLTCANTPALWATLALPNIPLAVSQLRKVVIVGLVVGITCVRYRYLDRPYTLLNTGLENTLASLHPTILISTTTILATTILLTQRSGVPTHRIKPLGTQLLTLTTLLSMWWANQELFWGYYWNWDPVEMTLLVHLLWVGALSHTLLKNKKTLTQHHLIQAYGLCAAVIYFLNKSPVAQSIHSFTTSFYLVIGNYTGGLCTATCILLLVVCVFVTKPITVNFRKTHKLPNLQLLNWNHRALAITTTFYVLTALGILVGGFEVSLLNKQTASLMFAEVITLWALISYCKVKYPQGYALPPTHVTALTALTALTLPWLKIRPDIYSIPTHGVLDGGSQGAVFMVEGRISVHNKFIKEVSYVEQRYRGFINPRHSILQPTQSKNNKNLTNIFYKYNSHVAHLSLTDRLIKPVW
jgi:hypothetical protein